MNHFAKAALCALALGAGIAGCSNDPTVITGGSTTNGSNIVFQQVDREGRPGIKELFLPYATHDAFNRITPMQDTTTSGAISTFVSSAPAGRSAAIASYVSNILTPDALIANFNDTSQRASYLGYETNAGIAADCQGQAPTVFGGRALTDDVVNVMLGLTFGNLATTSNPTTPLVTATAAPAGALAPDDGKEQTGAGGTPNLTNQMAPCSTKGLHARRVPVSRSTHLTNRQGPRRQFRIFGGRPNAAWGCSSAGRALASHVRGQEFESPHLHHENPLPG